MRQKAVTASLMMVAWRHSVGLVHAHHGYGVGEVVGVCRRLRLPLVLSLHGHDVTGLLDAQPVIYGRAREVLGAVVVPSRFLVRVAVARGFPEDKIHVIPSGVDTTKFTPTPLPRSTRDVLFVGRFVEKKGLDVLLAAWPAVRDAVPGARLRILGFGPLEGIARSGGDDVEVVLEPDHMTVRDSMKRAYVVVSPSRTADDDSVESLLVVNLEAQASGRPVVTTRHGGIPEFVSENETALVVPENDPAALGDALRRILLEPALAERLAAKGPGWVRQFDARRSAARVDALYGSLLSVPRRRSSAPGGP
jgi:glycosyltransferase involved in cell wall biosynthesis